MGKDHSGSQVQPQAKAAKTTSKPRSLGTMSTGPLHISQGDFSSLFPGQAASRLDNLFSEDDKEYFTKYARKFKRII